MEAADYITSGILQDYCLGLLTSQEERNVEAMCHAHPEVAKELELLRLALEEYASTNRLSGHDELRMSVWNAVKKLWEETAKH